MDRLSSGFIKSLVVAASLSLATAAAVSASGAPQAKPAATGFATIPLSTVATRPLSDLYIAPPTGTQTLGGTPFTTGSFALLTPGQTAKVNARVGGVVNVHLLLNSYNTMYYYAGQSLGTVRLTFSNGSVQETTVVVGTNVREWRVGAGTWVVRTVTSPANTRVWDGMAHLDGGEAVIDRLTIAVQPVRASLTGVELTNTATGTMLRTVFSGLTVEHLVRPGESGDTPAAEHSQAFDHSNSQNFTGVSPSKGEGDHD